MGVKKLGNLIKNKAPNCMTNHSLADFDNTIQAFDASIQIYKFVIAIRNNNKGKDILTKYGKLKSHIFGTWHKILTLMDHNILSVWIFDGPPPKIKKCTLNDRKKIKNNAKTKLFNKEYNNEKEKTRLMKKSFIINNNHIKDVQKLLNLIGIPYIQAIGEAEAQCAALNKANKIYGVVTEDWDALPFGSKIMLKNFTNKKQIKKIDLHILLKELDLTHSQFIDICILLGTDYSKSIKGLSPVELYEKYKKAGNIENLLNILRKNNYNIPDNYENNWMKVKKYYSQVKVLDPYDPKINLKWRKPDCKNLLKFLCNEYDFNRIKTKEKIDKLLLLHKQYLLNNIINHNIFTKLLNNNNVILNLNTKFMIDTYRHNLLEHATNLPEDVYN